LQGPITESAIGTEIDRYDAADASAVTDRIRSSAGIDVLADQYTAIYEELRQTPVSMTPTEHLAELAMALSAMTRRRSAPAQPRLFGVRRALLNSRMLSRPVRMLHRAWRLVRS
jgi:hypothetical protein